MFSNREIATAIWLAFVAGLTLTKPKVRTATAKVFRRIVNWKILLCLAAMALYTAFIVAGFHAVGLWRITMVKDTTLWLLFAASAIVVRIVTSGDNENILRQVLADSIKLIVLLEFLIGTYVMSLPAELALVPFITILVMLDTVARADEKNAPVARLTGALLVVVATGILGFAVSGAIGDYRNLGTINTIRSILFPPLMSIAFAPFIYVVVIVSTYESIFLRLKFGRSKAPSVVRYARRRIFFHNGFSLRRLRGFAMRTRLEIMRIESTEDVDRILKSA